MYTCNEAEAKDYDFFILACLLQSLSDQFRGFKSIGDDQRLDLDRAVCNSVEDLILPHLYCSQQNSVGILP